MTARSSCDTQNISLFLTQTWRQLNESHVFVLQALLCEYSRKSSQTPAVRQVELTGRGVTGKTEMMMIHKSPLFI